MKKLDADYLAPKQSCFKMAEGSNDFPCACGNVCVEFRFLLGSSLMLASILALVLASLVKTGLNHAQLFASLMGQPTTTLLARLYCFNTVV